MRLWLLALPLFACSSLIDGLDAPETGAADGGLDLVAANDDPEGLPNSAQSGGPEIGFQARVVNTNGKRLRMRSGPGIVHPVLELLPADEIVDVLAGPEEGVWFQVSLNQDAGWCHGFYLQPTADANQGHEPDAPDASGDPLPDDSTSPQNLLLPWHAGIGHRVTQGHNVGSHTNQAIWAWDFSFLEGTSVVAAHRGTVRLARGDSTLGGCGPAYAQLANYVVLDKGDGTETLYLHLKSTAVVVGQEVQRGEVIGESGATGWACGAHLHFQVQSSPDGGGSSGWYNQSEQGFFYDTGAPLDPLFDTTPISANQ